MKLTLKVLTFADYLLTFNYDDILTVIWILFVYNNPNS